MVGVENREQQHLLTRHVRIVEPAVPVSRTFWWRPQAVVASTMAPGNQLEGQEVLLGYRAGVQDRQHGVAAVLLGAEVPPRCQHCVPARTGRGGGLRPIQPAGQLGPVTRREAAQIGAPAVGRLVCVGVRTKPGRRHLSADVVPLSAACRAESVGRGGASDVDYEVFELREVPIDATARQLPHHVHAVTLQLVEPAAPAAYELEAQRTQPGRVCQSSRIVHADLDRHQHVAALEVGLLQLRFLMWHIAVLCLEGVGPQREATLLLQAGVDPHPIAAPCWGRLGVADIGVVLAHTGVAASGWLRRNEALRRCLHAPLPLDRR
mmetsp:Transcript_22546/g.62614  ORF Transcript_22546/g.62614 Transcript_22546/m.62614 type:complete len:321 (-) Transcript_22546:60-1022(-)